MKTRIKFKKTTIALLGLFAMGTLWAAQLNVGKSVVNVKIKTPNDKETEIPFLGSKVLAVFYTDPDVKDINDALTDAIKAKAFSSDKYKGIGIANCNETWLPNSLIRYAGRQKQSRYPNSIILVDEKGALSKAWELGDCNDVGYIIIVGSDSKIKFAKAVKSSSESKALIPSILSILEKEIHK